jgi:hypothetical protein
MPERLLALSCVQSITLSLSKLSLLQRMASNDNNGKRKLKEEAESSTARKRLWLSNDGDNDDDSSDSLEEEMEEMKEEVSSEETLMNQLNTSEEKLFAKRGHGMVFSDDGDNTSPSSEPCSPKSHRCSDEDNNDNDDDDDF